MKTVLIISLFFTTICLFSCSKEDEMNYKVTKAMSLEQSVSQSNNITSSVTGNYVKACPDGFSGCGATSGIECAPSQQPCTTPPKPILRQYPCSGSGLIGCKAGLQSGPTCPSAIICPGENHPSPCNFGSIAFGCFSGSPIGGPSCSPLVNCQTPPD